MYCHACGADGPDADSQHESEARSAWNRRTPQPVVREPLTDEQIARIARSVLEAPVTDGVAPAWELAVGVARAIEAEVRKQDDELIQQLVEALEYVRNTPEAEYNSKVALSRAQKAITAARARLGEKT